MDIPRDVFFSGDLTLLAKANPSNMHGKIVFQVSDVRNLFKNISVDVAVL